MVIREFAKVRRQGRKKNDEWVVDMKGRERGQVGRREGVREMQE